MSPADEVIASLHAGHAQLAPVVEKLGEKKLTTETFPGEWDLSQVISHLGSGALITRNILDAALSGHASPGPEMSQEIWAVWDAMSPVERRDAYPGANEQYLGLLDSIDESTRESLRIDLGFVPEPVDLATAAAFRLNEFALHSWDIRAALDGDAVLEDSAVPHLLDLLPALLGALNRSEGLSLHVELLDHQDYRLDFGDAPTSTVRLPAEAWIRLVTGRLRPEYTPAAVTIDGDLSLDDLRAVFPGY